MSAFFASIETRFSLQNYALKFFFNTCKNR